MNNDLMLPEQPLRLVFDVAGVLLIWNPEVVFGPVFKESGKSKDHFFQEICGAAFQERISRGEDFVLVISETLEKHPDWAYEIKLWETRWDEMLTGSMGGTISVVEELKERNHRVFILGNWNRSEFERARRRFAFLDDFDGVLLSGDCGILKPDLAIFARAESQFGLNPAETIFIDDREANVRAAIERGWNGLVFQDARHLYLSLMEYGIL
jgi:2-haloacid dehalogenase